MQAGIYITATPIGNLKDITLRALECLKEVDAIICEDTRVTAKLLSHYGIEKKLIVYNDHSDEAARERILLEVASGAAYALVSDAGTPLISDPGYKLIRDAQQKGLYITTLPGASSVIAGITLSGLPSDSFLFLGFLPPKVVGKKKEFEKVKGVDTTIVLFERGSRVAETLEAARDVLGDVEASVVREITKLYEQVKTNTLSKLLDIYKVEEPRGEVVILLSNKPDENNSLSPEILNEKLTFLLYNNSVKDAAQIAHELYGISKKEAYEKLLKLKEGK
jgi:16S rRNA (cytidine1402-2'-O)-methyltransferase